MEEMLLLYKRHRHAMNAYSSFLSSDSMEIPGTSGGAFCKSLMVHDHLAREGKPVMIRAASFAQDLFRGDVD